jgi:hypothetical protein
MYNPIIPSRNIGLLWGFSTWLFLAVCLPSFHDFPVIFASPSTVLLHATFGLPCGFQRKASHAISLGSLRSVWPSHPPFWRQISKSILISLVRVHRSFDMWNGPNTRKFLLRHILINTCNCFVIVLLAFHVSQPYERTDFTLELNRRSFIPMEYALAFQVLCSAPNAMRAFCVLCVATSFSVSPLSSVILPNLYPVSVWWKLVVRLFIIQCWITPV